ncbi:MAG: hypothetical protein LC721_08955 [Actinobacteria bacterium]|nr:hypothetical protein [Actinomycetota bacterium]
MRTQREPNRLLAAVMQQAGVSNKGLATRVRAEALKTGHDISPDHVSVRRWLDGMRPHQDTVRCIAAALSAKLNRRVTFAEIGFDSVAEVVKGELIDDGAQYSPCAQQAVNVLATVTSADLTDSPALAASTWISATAPSVISGYLFAEPQRIEYAGSLSDASAGIAGRIRATTRCLMGLDFQFGGGHTRKMLLAYWNTEIVPALRRRYPGAVARDVMSAGADAAEVLGWSAYDAGQHGAAQRYFVQGLRLAREANDRLMGGQILSNLSHQANYLGNFSEAIQFARAAQAATVGEATATVRAMFLAMEARALASIGDAQACAAVLHRAEQAFDQRNPSDDPDWISYFDEWELAGEAAHCFRDLGQPRETVRFATQAIDPVHTPARTRAFIEMVRAAGAVHAGDLNQAVSIATDAVRFADCLQSSRYLQYVANFHRLLTEKNASHPSVPAFTELVRVSYPTLVVPNAA